MRKPKTTAACAAALLAVGCAPVTTLDGERLALTSEAFRTYVESVFRKQNAVATDLTFALEDEGLSEADSAVLESAEAALLAACEGLNELAAERRDGEKPGGIRAAKAARQAPQCELAARNARAALDLVGEEATDRD